MDALPDEILWRIGDYLWLEEMYLAHFVLQSSFFQELRFPLRFPVRSDDCANFCKWLFRWRHTLHGVKKISINYFRQNYRSPLFEILGMCRFPTLRHLVIINMLCLFDGVLLFAFRNFLGKCDSVENVHVDARLSTLYRDKRNPDFHAHGVYKTKLRLPLEKQHNVTFTHR